MRENFLLNVLQKNVDEGTDPAYWWDEERTPLDSIDKRVTDLMDLSGKKAVVTGGAGVNLDQACVNRLAGLGADVAVADLPKERSEAWTRAAGRTPLLDAEGVAEKFSERTNCTAVAHLWDEPAVREHFGIPDAVEIGAVVPVGYPEGRYGPVARKPVSEVIFRDRWGSP
ncbi:hypothetical protein PSU4_07090 [Pseudonocardia sulfidoxydans NBRC 16205]|uniref:Nitroreductase n=1 Tax=Pseudonocardia sulfidoxydans NBRC 16205 TaxID=1223511 RepID=A0A511DAB1_9PSEU|nr:hypothetical protein [Pseudonocardia sulfidoxydans]GEL21755.1 hypothetical protein PSU4_07090 [Pseudonocardia sulfidoxydans NBRC 16205]